MLVNNEIKINTTDSDDFRAIVKLLKISSMQENHFLHNIAYHTYQCKQSKPYKIVIRGLHPFTSTLDIKEELAKSGHEAIRITNVIIKKKMNATLIKVPLSLFYVDMITKSNNKDVYKLTDMLHCKIKIEPPRIKKEIPQCKRCQGFGHTQNYCQRQAKYVKCGDSHRITDCKKPKKAACKCVNCGSEHTANWPTYQDRLTSIHKFKTTVTQRVQQKVRTYSNNIIPTKSFAEAVNGELVQTAQDHIESQAESVEPTIYDIWKLIKNIQEKLANTERKLETIEKNNKYTSQTIEKKKKKKNDRKVAQNC